MDKNFLDTLSKDGDAYLIASADDLCNLSEYVNAGNDCKDLIFKLANDIDLSSVENFTPIGTQKNLFAGTFDGNGKTISNLKINSESDYVGLFGYAGSNCMIKNVNLIDAKVNGERAVGGLVGYNNHGKIENCTASGNVSGEKFVGGLVGWNNGGTIENCTARGDVTGNDDIGGLVGYNRGTIENCTAKGDVTGNDDIGGLVGDNLGETKNCEASGNVCGDGLIIVRKLAT